MKRHRDTFDWIGEGECRPPYWDLRPRNRMLLGVRHLQLVVEAPLNCNGTRLATQAEVTFRRTLDPFPLIHGHVSGPRVLTCLSKHEKLTVYARGLDQ